MKQKLKTFEDFTTSLDNEDFLSNDQKGPSGSPNSYKDLEALKLKNKGKLKSKKRKVDVFPQAHTLGISTKSASMVLPPNLR